MRTARYPVRSERLCCAQLGYPLLRLWFLDRECSEGGFHHSVFAKNCQRVLSADVAGLFFAEVCDLSRQQGRTSDEHGTADGTLVESGAGLKRFVRKDGAGAKKVRSAPDGERGNPTINFRGEKRANATPQGPTDPESVLYRKAPGKEAKRGFGGHIRRENRTGLCADFPIHDPIAEPEPVGALPQVGAHQELPEGTRVKTPGADKGHHRKAFVAECREQGIAPQVACKEGVRVPGPDGRTRARERALESAGESEGKWRGFSAGSKLSGA